MYSKPERVNACPRALTNSSGTAAVPLTANQARRAAVVVCHNGKHRSLRPLPWMSMLAWGWNCRSFSRTPISSETRNAPWPDCKLVVEGDKGQAKTLAYSKDRGDTPSAVSGRERKVFIPSGGLPAGPPSQVLAKKMSSLCTDCLLQNHQIFTWESQYLGLAAPRNNTLSVIPALHSR